MKKLILVYGIIAGIVVSAMLFIGFSGSEINMDSGELLGYATMIIAFSTIFIAIKTYRDKQSNGSIKFGKAFKIGLGITIIATVLYVISWMIISETMAKDFATEYYQHSIETLKASNLPQDELAEKIARLEQYSEMYENPLIKIGMTFMEIFPVGFIVSLIAALILKRRVV